MTTTSADNGTSAGDSGGSGGGGDWSWFAPPKKPSAEQEHPGERGGEGAAGPEEIPSRPVTPIRPVGSGAERRAQGPPAAGRPSAVMDTGPQRVPDPRPAEEHQRAAAPGGAARPAAVPVPGTEPSPDALLIRGNLEEIEPIADSVTAYFYAMLFVQHPELRDLFPASMDSQRDRLFKALLTAAKLVDDPEILVDYLSHLGRGHRKYGTRPEHYPAVGECLLGALAQYAGNTWNDAAEAAWVRAYTAISQIMIDAAAEDEKRAPAWWDAEVVAHETRTPGVAVLTVRPDQPYPFLAGQYTSLETPWWPRVWRHYSFASAPRHDGLLTFHIRAVPAGWVSSALVHRARPGDVIRLGPPAGSMTVDHSSDTGLLCLGGGTGIAPIKAMVEDVAERGRPRPVEVFYGARSDHDLYDLETMLHLERRHPWLAVRPVVSAGTLGGPPSLADAGGPGARPLTGDLPDVVRHYGPWAAYDGYLSGPPGMIRSGVDAMKGAGIPAHRIRHDSLDELAAAAG